MPITTTAELARVCQQFTTAPHIAVDTEFMRETTYYPQLCLVQLATPDLAVAIDPLAAGIALDPLFDLFAKRGVVKVFHAAKQDLQIFFKLCGKLPQPIYDTQIAAMVCGLGDQVGYDKLIHSLLGISIDKASRFTDWARRPLSQAQCQYALDDVVYLTQAYPLLRQRIAKAGREGWLVEEMADLIEPSQYHANPADAWQRIKQRVSKGDALNRLRHLAEWREATAQTRNIPRAWLLRDDVLVAIASQRPRKIAGLADIRGISNRLVKNDGAALLATMDKADSEDKSRWPPLTKRRNKPAPQAATELLRVLLHHTAESLEVAPRLLASQSDLETMARTFGRGDGASSKKPNEGKNKQTLLPMTGWRYEVFGKYAADLLAGKIALSLDAPSKHNASRNIRITPIPSKGE